VGRLAQELPPGDERLQENIAHLGALIQDASYGSARNLIDLTASPSDCADDRRHAGQVRDISRKLPLAMDGDPLRLVAREIDDLDFTRLDDEKLEVTVADGKERLPVLIESGHSSRAGAQSSDLGVVERRERDGLEVVACGHRLMLRNPSNRQLADTIG